MDWTFIAAPISGAVIGYFTNWLAIKMLFLPYKEKYLFGIKIPFTPGIIPKERKKLATGIGGAAGEHVLTKDTINKCISSDLNKEKIEESIKKYLYCLKENDYTLEQIINMIFSDKSEDIEIFLKEFLKSKIIEISENDDIYEKITDVLSICIKKAVTENNQVKLKEIIDKYFPVISYKAISLLNDNSEIDIKLREFTKKIINENLGKIAGMFVNSDKIYSNIKTALLENLIDNDKSDEIKKKVYIFIDNLLINNGEKIENLLRENLIKFQNNSLKSEIINFSLKYSDKIIEYILSVKIMNIIKIISEEKLFSFIHKSVNKAVDTAADYVSENIEFSKLIEDKINNFEIEEAENIIISLVKKELNAITYFGGVLGFIIGFIPLIIDMIK